MWYTYDILGRFAGTSETQTPRSTEIAPPDLVPEWNWSGEKWVYARVPERPVMPLPQRNVDDVRKELLEKVQAEKVRVRDGGLTLNGTHWDTDERAQAAYVKYALGLMQDQTLTIPDWKASAGVWVEMNASLFQELQDALKEHESALFTWQRQKEAEIAACETVEELEAVDVVYS